MNEKPTLQKIFTGAATKLRAEYEDAFSEPHPAKRGQEREDILSEFLSSRLPRSIGKPAKRMSELETFCRQARARSAENRQAMLAVRALPGQMISILRQELDSLVRVVFLLAQNDREYRHRLIEDSVSGRRWCRRDSKQPVTDRAMVDLTDTLHGWTRSVYAFGCAFIHLSSFHDYQARDPLDQISDVERNAILDHLRYYHGGPHGDSPRFSDVVPFLPMVFTKIADNLECYVKQIEQNGDLEG